MENEGHKPADDSSLKSKLRQYTDLINRLYRQTPEGRRASWKEITEESGPNGWPAPFFEPILESFLCDSDRGFVLVAAEVLDNELEELLRAFFRSQSSASKKEIEFFFTTRPLPPLQSTSIKLRLARVLGLIHRDIMSACLALQTLRSANAAHKAEHFELQREQVAGIIKALPKEMHEVFLDDIDELGDLADAVQFSDAKVVLVYFLVQIIGPIFGRRKEIEAASSVQD